MGEFILIEIIAAPAEQSRGRHNPRAVKRKLSNFPTKARAAPAPHQVFHYDDLIRIVAPAAPPGTARASAAAPEIPPKRCRRRRRETTRAAAFWREHIRSWRTSGLSRTAYCQDHGLKLRSFHAWVTRLRHSFRRPQKGTSTA